MKSFLLHIWTVLLAIGVSNSVNAQGAVSATFDQDTSYLCLLEPATISPPSVSGGIAPYTFSWFNGQVSDSISFIPVLPVGSIWVEVSDVLGSKDTAYITIIGLPECVWPGDANGDLLSNNLDLLYIGRSYGTPGMIRPDAHTNWIGQGAPSWTHTFNGTVNYAHADTDGDGIIAGTDVLPINWNYSGPQTNNLGSPGLPGAVPLSVEWSGSSYDPGDTITAPILLGTNQIPADSIYGLAFSILYDTTLIQAGSVSIQTGGGWLGDSGTSAISLYEDFYGAGQVDVGITRITKTPISGKGRVGDITVMIDDITGKKAGLETVNFWIDYVHLIDAQGNYIPVSAVASQFSIVLSLDDPWLEEAASQVEVRNLTDRLDIRTGQDWNVEAIGLIDLTGKHISDVSNAGGSWSIGKAGLSKGVYLMEISFRNGRRLSRKVVID